MANSAQEDLFDSGTTGDANVARSLLDQLLADSRMYHESESYKKLFEFVIRLRNVAPFNAMLLQLQKPGLTYAASAHDWKQRFQRGIKEDARPLLILWPFGPVATVYDVLDTFDVKNPKNEAIPPEMSSFFASGDISKIRMSRFVQVLQRKNIDLQWLDHGDGSAGRIQQLIIPEIAKHKSEQQPSKLHPRYRVKINQNHSLPVQFTTLAHELAHLCLGHLGPDKSLNIPRRRPLNHAEVEIEAESAAYLVCERNGVTSNSESYLANYVDKNFGLESIDLYQIMRAAGQIETLLELTNHTKFAKPRNATSQP